MGENGSGHAEPKLKVLWIGCGTEDRAIRREGDGRTLLENGRHVWKEWAAGTVGRIGRSTSRSTLRCCSGISGSSARIIPASQNQRFQ